MTTVIATPSSSAEACSCVHPGYELLSPAADAPAPRNARVRVAFSSGWGHSVSVVLRTASGLTLPTRSTTIQAGGLSVVELAVKRALPANVAVEVIALEGEVATVVGRFTTGRTLDNRAPRWAGVSRALLVDTRRRRAASARTCSSASRYAVLRGASATDDQTSASGMLYAVWLADRRGRADTALPPLALVPMRDGRLWLGSRDPCDRVKLRFPSGPVKLAVAAVDAAGNRSPARVIDLRLRRR